MARSIHLKSAKKQLSDFFFSEFHEDNVLALSYDKEHLPIAFLVVEKDFPNIITLSLSSEMEDVQAAVTIAIVLSRITQVELAENFYIDNEGIVSWGQEANNKFIQETVDVQDILMRAEPPNELKH